MEFVIILLLIVVILLLLYLIFNQKKKSSNDINKIFDDKLKQNNLIISEMNNSLYEKINGSINVLITRINDLTYSFSQTKDLINEKFNDFKNSNSEFYINFLRETNETITNLKEKISASITDFNKEVNESLKSLNESIHNELNIIRNQNNEELEKINKAVNEKLEITLENKLKSSFDNVIKQIGGVNEAIGEIKGIATDVGSLKNVLTNVKTKGIVGEVILGNIIDEILTKNQYEENIATKKKSNDRVEFAIKLPGKNDDIVYLPIDSKLPLENYSRIKDGIESGNVELINEGRNGLKSAIKTYAKDVNQKYIDVPNTTDFAIMFLPIEGLYVEVLNLGLFEEVQSKYHIIIAGPTTLTALLNALQMGFKTLAIQKKSADVFKLLSAVKTEFEKFASVLETTQRKVNDASNQLDQLVGTRTRQIQSKLKGLESLDEEESKEVLGIE